MNNNCINSEKLSLGVCYYPEHWDESLWESDLERMLDAGIETIRIAEFAWSCFEPDEGTFTFELFDRFLEKTVKYGMKVIFGTPTATPPAWLTEKYPEVLNADINGVLYRHGSRRHCNYNSPKYRELSAIITEKLAAHYGRHPQIVGWQIDNELNAEADRFYSDADTDAFRRFLQNKYVTLDALNDAWGARFWNQTYSSWDQVYVPRKTTNGAINPHLNLDYYRFISESVIEFVKIETDIIRKYISPDVFITTNGMFPHIDNHRLTREALDFYMYDSYPNFANGTGGRRRPGDMADRGWSRSLTETRSISPNFGIMEQQSSANSWNIWGLSPKPRPGQLKLWTMQSIAHGADFVSYFRWRTATFGTEIYWHGILNYDNLDTRHLDEVKEVHELIEKLPGMAGKKYSAAFAVLEDYDNVCDAEIDSWHGAVARESDNGIFCASQFTHTPFDYVALSPSTSVEDLLRYPVIFSPHSVILTEKTASLLKNYVKAGGTLVIGCRTGYKDERGHCRMMPLPGFASELAGVVIRDSTAIPGGEEPPMIDWDGDIIESGIYNDILTPADDDVEVLGRYTDAYYKGMPAITRRPLGDGFVYLHGGTFRESTARAFLSKLSISDPYRDIVSLPESCELAVRGNYLIILNYSKESADIALKRALRSPVTGNEDCGTVTLPAFGVAVYEL